MSFFQPLSDKELEVLKDEEIARKRVVDAKVEAYRITQDASADRDRYLKTKELDQELDAEKKKVEAAKLSRLEDAHTAELIRITKESAAETKFIKEEADRAAKLAKADSDIASKEAVAKAQLEVVTKEHASKADELKQLASIPELVNRAHKAEADSKGKDIAIEHLKEDIKRLDDLVKFMSGLIPKFELDKVGITLNADIKVEPAKGGKDQNNKGGDQQKKQD